MGNRVRFLIEQHFAHYAVYYMITVFVYCAALTAGASMGDSVTLPIPGKTGWVGSLFILIITLAGTMLCSYSIFAIPGALALIGFRAFLAGAFAGLRASGALVIIVGVIPHQLLIAPVVIVACVYSMKQAVSLRRGQGGWLPQPERNRIKILSIRRTLGLILVATPSLLWELNVIPSIVAKFGKL